MNELVNDRVLTDLPPAQARLAALFSRPRTAALICVMLLTTLGWIALAVGAGSESRSGAAGLFEVLCRRGEVVSGASAAIAAGMWIAMVFAMMLPSAGPMIFTYAEIADTAARRGEQVVSPFVLAGGYAAVWIGFALGAAGLQTVIAVWVAGRPEPGGGIVSGAVFVVAGLYQFSRMKQACLAVCRRPFPFFFANWTTRPSGVFRLGLHQGAHCVGCCWAMMLIMLASGAMNVIWMAALGIAMTAEKMTETPHLSRILGAACLGVGGAIALAGSWP